MYSDFHKDFVTSIESQLGTVEAHLLLDALNATPATSVRLNPAKPVVGLYEECSRVQWCGQGRYLPERPQFTLDPLLHAGAYYVQESSSMIVGEIARSFAPERVLDLCAAPGGKSTHLAEVIGENGFLVANEVIKSRAAILCENVIKWGSGNVVVTNSDPAKFNNLPSFFDLVVVDAPCSGEGMFRKDRASRDEWTPENVELCASRARRIVSDVWNSLAQDGIMIFSTCTFNRAENEENVSWICRELGAEVVDIEWPEGAVDSGFGAHFYPHKVKGEGLFCAVLRKRSECNFEVSSRAGRPLVRLSKSDTTHLQQWVSSDLEFKIGGRMVYGYSKVVLEVIEELLGALNVIYSGVQMGEMIRGELKPAHALALYSGVRPLSVSEVESDEALEYLRLGTLSGEMYVDGLSLVMSGGCGLGWVKKIAGGRLNNNYPQSWRVRM